MPDPYPGFDPETHPHHYVIKDGGITSVYEHEIKDPLEEQRKLDEKTFGRVPAWQRRNARERERLARESKRKWG